MNSNAGKSKSFQDLLKESIQLLRAGEQGLGLRKADEAFSSLKAAQTVMLEYTEKSDFYLAVVIEHLLVLKSESGISRIFEHLKNCLLLKPEFQLQKANYTLKAYLNAMNSLGYGETAAAELIGVLKKRRQGHPVQDDTKCDELLSLLDSILDKRTPESKPAVESEGLVLHRPSISAGAMPCVAPPGEPYAGTENLVAAQAAFDETLTCIEEILDAGSGRMLGYEDDLRACVGQYPQLLDQFPQNAERLTRCIRKSFGYPVIKSLVKLISRYERHRAAEPHFHFKDLWAEILLDPQSNQHLAGRSAFLEFAVLFFEDMDRIEWTPILINAMPFLGSLQLAGLKKILNACQNGLSLPVRSLGLQNFALSPKSTPQRQAEACEVLLELLKISASRIAREQTNWIVDDIKKSLAGLPERMPDDPVYEKCMQRIAALKPGNEPFSISEPLTLRPEKPADYPEIDALLESAFGGRDEPDLVARIRVTPEYIPELTLVARSNQAIIGYLMLSYVNLHDKENSYRVLSLAPVAVLPSFQKQGIGGTLIRKCIELAQQTEERLIVLLGHESYYPRFGFQRASLHNIHPPAKWPDTSYMVYLLSHYEPGMKGTVIYPPAWRIPFEPERDEN